MSFETLWSYLAPPAFLIAGAALAYLGDFGKFRRGRNADKKALESALAAEIYANISLVIEGIGEYWSALAEGAEHLPAKQFVVHSSVFASFQNQIGLIAPEAAAQIIYLYARLNDLVRQHQLVTGYPPDDQLGKSFKKTMAGYVTHHQTLTKMQEELAEDAIELVRILNRDNSIGEGDVSFDLRPAVQSAKSASIRARYG